MLTTVVTDGRSSDANPVVIPLAEGIGGVIRLTVLRLPHHAAEAGGRAAGLPADRPEASASAPPDTVSVIRPARRSKCRCW